MHTATNRVERKLAYADFLTFPEDGHRHELIDGVHYVSPSPHLSHQAVLGNLHFHLRVYLETHPAGTVLFAPVDVVFTMFDIVAPDLLFVAAERRQIIGEANVQGAPDLVVDVRSRSTARRDEGVKLDVYDRGGVKEYWVIDPRTEVVRVYRRDARGLVGAAELGSDGHRPLTSPLLPGFALPLRLVFAR